MKLHAKRGMAKNEKVLGLTDRYAHRYGVTYMLLKRKQQCPGIISCLAQPEIVNFDVLCMNREFDTFLASRS